ncbi:MAG: protoporphyrinogen oxidase HemJ [Alphaproteobacteria bacterium]|nr:protoporphyrinogen oxidase HemJ [Alphaproteobacteria bacterium]
MIDLSTNAYLWLKALHLIAAIAWMAGLFYLPRLFVYHTQVKPGSEQSELFKVMERRLYRAIMQPAMLATLGLGSVLLLDIDNWIQGWLHGKLGLIFFLLVFHFMCARWKNHFARDANPHSERYFRFANEIPTLIMIGIVVLVIVKPI